MGVCVLHRLPSSVKISAKEVAVITSLLASSPGVGLTGFTWGSSNFGAEKLRCPPKDPYFQEVLP